MVGDPQPELRGGEEEGGGEGTAARGAATRKVLGVGGGV